MKEDTIDFLLNVKSIRLRPIAPGDGRLTLIAEGEGVVTAGEIDLSAEFEIVNPDLHLATLDSPKSKLVVELNVEQGTGYRPAAQNTRLSDFSDSLPIGIIPVDAIFTPVRKVNYNVETISIGQQSYEKLIMDVWTDGTISPVDAISQSAHILIEQFQLFYELARVPLRVGEKQPRLPIPLEQYNMPIEELGLSVRTFNCLKRASVTKVGELLEKNEAELLGIKNFGRKALDEVKGKLTELGLVTEEAEGADGGVTDDQDSKEVSSEEEAL
jgi:DNA-directed RNA polymerase subunit alpha